MPAQSWHLADLPAGTVTLFFTDVEGSTRLLQEVGERYDDALADHHRIIRGALELHGEAIRESTGAALAAAERSQHDLLSPQSRTRLGDDAFKIAWAEGKAMPTERAIELALESARS